MQIKDKIAVVTGGASGLGEGTVRRFIAGGGKAAIFDMDEARGQALAAEFPDRAIFCRVDVADEASVQAGIAATKAAFGAIHVCVNCAGIPGTLGRTVSKKGPYPQAEFMRVLREAAGALVGLPATSWMLELGAIVLRTETELILKSRRVVPARLLEGGFTFRYASWPEAARDLCAPPSAAPKRREVA